MKCKSKTGKLLKCIVKWNVSLQIKYNPQPAVHHSSNYQFNETISQSINQLKNQSIN